MPKMLIKDLNLAAFLVAMGLEYEIIPAEKYGRYDIAFENNEELRQSLQNFNSGVKVAANLYSETIKQLKSALYSYKSST